MTALPCYSQRNVWRRYPEASITDTAAAVARNAALATWLKERESLEAEAEAVRVVAAAEMTAAKQAWTLERSHVEQVANAAVAAAAREVEDAKAEARRQTCASDVAHAEAAEAQEFRAEAVARAEAGWRRSERPSQVQSVLVTGKPNPKPSRPCSHNSPARCPSTSSISMDSFVLVRPHSCPSLLHASTRSCTAVQVSSMHQHGHAAK